MDLNKSNVKKILGIVAAAILLYTGLQHIGSVMSFFGGIWGLVYPFFLGACMAFIFNVPMRSIEQHLFKKEWRWRSKKGNHSLEKLKRPVCLVITLAIVILLIWFVCFMILPELGRTFGVIADSAPEFARRVQSWADDQMSRFPAIADYVLNLEVDWEKIGQELMGFLQRNGGNFLDSTIGMASTIVGGLVNFVLAFVFAIYVLLQKEKLGKQGRKLFYAFLPEWMADRILDVGALSERTFSRFLSGQGLEAVILGTLFFIAMTIFRFPYALMISVLIAATALIPIFGAFIGCFVGAFLILIDDPIKAFWFIVMFLIIQQLEGNLIYPHVVGSSVGLPSIWVLVAVTVGGSTMGIGGMLIFIPAASVIYVLLRQSVYKRLKTRSVPAVKFKPVPEEKGPKR